MFEKERDRTRGLFENEGILEIKFGLERINSSIQHILDKLFTKVSLVNKKIL